MFCSDSIDNCETCKIEGELKCLKCHNDYFLSSDNLLCYESCNLESSSIITLVKLN